MSNDIDDGGSAFPINSPSGTPERMPLRDGMSLRDWFAGKALSGFAGKLSENDRENLADRIKGGAIEARAAYALADAMLAARKNS
jgi:hypothetical protein